MAKRYSVRLVSASFNEHSGTGIIEYGVRLAKALNGQKCDIDFYTASLVKGNVFATPKHLYEEADECRKVENPDIIHYLDPGFAIGDALFHPKAFSKSVVTIHDLDMFKSTSTGLRLTKQYTNPLAFFRRPLIIIVTPFALVLRNFATKFVVKRAKKLVCVSEKTRDELVKAFKIKPERCAIAYPIIGNDFKPMRTRRNRKKTIIGHFSSYLPNKNVGTLINAFKQTKSDNLELHLYGGSLPFRINDDPRIKYHGFVSTERLPRVLNSFDVFVFPSVWEGFGMPIMEAKKCKIPVITYAKAELPNIVKRNTLQFKDQPDLTRMLEHAEWKRVDTKKASGDAKACSGETIARNMIGIYKEIISDGGG